MEFRNINTFLKVAGKQKFFQSGRATGVFSVGRYRSDKAA